MRTMIDSDFEHCNQQHVYERMIGLRDLLGDLYAAGARGDTMEYKQAFEIGERFKGDMTLFRFMDEKPGHHLVNGRPPALGVGGPGRYYDGRGREGWHILLRQLRNSSDAFWAGLDAFRGATP